MTKNRPCFSKLIVLDEKKGEPIEIGLNESFEHIKNCFIACNGVVWDDVNSCITGDELDMAMFTASHASYFNETTFIKGDEKIEVLQNFPFDSFRGRQSCIVRIGSEEYLYTKGSINSIRKVVKVIPAKILEIINKYELSGYRIIGMAYSATSFKEGKEIDENNQEFLGFALFRDEIREESSHVIEELKNGGIDLKVCTGDAINTAISVTCEVGMAKPKNLIFPFFNENSKIGFKNIYGDEIEYPLKNKFCQFVVSGNIINKICKDQLGPFILKNTVIFARCDPLQKETVVQLLQGKNEQLMFVGDGENDVGALKRARLGYSFSADENQLNAIFSSNSLQNVVELLKIGRTSFISASSIFKFCLYNNFSATAALIASGFYKTTLSDISCLFLDFLVYYICTPAINYLKPVDTIENTLISLNFNKDVLYIGIEMIYNFIFLFSITSYFGHNNDFKEDELDMSAKHGAALFFCSFFFIITSLVTKVKFKEYKNLIFASKIPRIVFILSVLFFVLFYALYIFDFWVVGFIMKFSYLDSIKEKGLLTSLMFLHLFLCVISSKIFG